ncbi:hypothetical protein SAMN05421770_10196 [Granulicella rosea]|uniref:Uncharacterized protein n=1 Tax=Granulicella rosea TaxID=474952 RepID=A0A239CT69_9BACT|nr:hypothetical protein [Granulicella rosea]SNS23287.1 hypothetical protein SAMN05421770_10196 [Granulicella rosea]
MRPLSACLLFLTLASVPAFGQTTSAPAAAAVVPANANDPSVDYAALREDLSRQNKILTEQVATQRAIVKKNQDLLKEAQKLQAANLKLTDEKHKLEAQNADLEKQRAALKAQQKPAE